MNPSSYVFNSYSNDSVQIVGFIVVTLFLKETLKNSVAVYVSSMESKPLLGRNAMISLHVAPCIDRITTCNASNQIETKCSYLQHISVTSSSFGQEACCVGSSKANG